MIKTSELNPLLIDVFSLPNVPLTKRHELPTSNGIYFCCSQGSIVYIGSTVSVLGFRGRWNRENHDLYAKFSSCSNPVIHYLEVEDFCISDEKLIRLCEKHLIRIWQPKFNGTRTTEAHIDALYPCWSSLLVDEIRVEDSPYICDI